MSDQEPISLSWLQRPLQGERRRLPTAGSDVPISAHGPREAPALVVFNRHELSEIFNVYGRRVAAGEWRDYAIDWGRETAVFSIFRRASEVPIYRVMKQPKLARRQGAYSIVSATGQILKRGHELRRVLDAIDTRVSLVR